MSALDQAAIRQAVEQIAREHLRFEGTIDDGQNLVEALRLDSLRLLTLVVEIENHFKICLDEDREQEIVTARDLMTAIEEKLAERPHDSPAERP